MEKDYYKRKTCRLCEAKKLKRILSFGSSPVGGGFVSRENLTIKQKLYPLTIYQCISCGHVQLIDVINPEILFSNYSYFSGRTGLIKHFSDYSEKIISSNHLNQESFVVDIGSNDGAFLKFFKDKGIKVLGIDPAENVARFANEAGVETISAMFDMKISEKIKRDYGCANIITANNVFAHTDDMIGMAKSAKNLLKIDGLFYFEVSYLLDVIDKMLFGTIFHEHLCYHTVKPLVSFLNEQGLELIDVERVPIQGGSIICKAQLIGGKREISPIIDELIKLESEKGVYKGQYFKEFSDKVGKLKSDMNILIKDIKFKNMTIAAYGAARGGTLITYLFNLGENIDYIVDDDAEKQNLFSPGFHIPIFSPLAINERKPDYMIILAWVHSKSIISNNKKYLENGGKFITFFPKVDVVDIKKFNEKKY